MSDRKVLDRKVLRVGLIGSGFAARFHYAAIRRVVAVRPEVVGVYSPTQAHRDAFAAERGIRSYPGADELIEHPTDLVPLLARRPPR